MNTDLTLRELEVLALIVEGMRNSEIGQELGIGENTVETHTHRIYHKLGVSTRTQAATYALKRGLVSLKKEPEVRDEILD